MGTYILKRKIFTKYDDTDTLKRMKDSDILAEKPREEKTTNGKILSGAAGGALLGAGIGAAVTGFGKRFKKKPLGKRLKTGGKWGMAIGGTLAAAALLSQRDKEREENEFYNQRLAYAQHHARRREQADWKSNMTQRDGYSY